MTLIEDPNRQFRCCICLHVRTGTIILGVSLMLLHFVVISVLTLATIRPEILPSTADSYGHNVGYTVMSVAQPHKRSRFMSAVLHLIPGISDFHSNTLSHKPQVSSEDSNDSKPYPQMFALSDEDTTDRVNNNLIEHSKHDDDLTEEKPRYMWDFYGRSDVPHGYRYRRHFSPYFALCLSLFSFTFCLFLVHGAVARQPTHLLPFFFLHVFDFIISVLSVIGYMSSTSEVRVWLPSKSGEFSSKSANVTFLFVLVSCCVLLFKAYCLRVVWDCYKYLTITNQGVGSVFAGSYSNRHPFWYCSLWALLDFDIFRSIGRRIGRQPSRFDPSESQYPSNVVVPDPSKFVQQADELPKYEDTLKTPANAFAPPPYFRSSDARACPAPSATTTNQNST